MHGSGDPDPDPDPHQNVMDPHTVYGENFLFFFISDDLKRLVGVVQDGDPRPAIS